MKLTRDEVEEVCKRLMSKYGCKGELDTWGTQVAALIVSEYLETGKVLIEVGPHD